MTEKDTSSKKRGRIYTRRGDLGETSLCFGPRVGKDQQRIVVVGTLDELNSWLGLIRTEEIPSPVATLLLEIQQKISSVSTEVATFEPGKLRVEQITPQDIEWLETNIDQWEESLPPLNQFIIPGGKKPSALTHVARSVCRRTERCLVALVRSDETVSRLLISWLNRLGDLLFVLARVLNQ